MKKRRKRCFYCNELFNPNEMEKFKDRYYCSGYHTSLGEEQLDRIFTY